MFQMSRVVICDRMNTSSRLVIVLCRCRRKSYYSNHILLQFLTSPAWLCCDITDISALRWTWICVHCSLHALFSHSVHNKWRLFSHVPKQACCESRLSWFNVCVWKIVGHFTLHCPCWSKSLCIVSSTVDACLSHVNSELMLYISPSLWTLWCAASFRKESKKIYSWNIIFSNMLFYISSISFSPLCGAVISFSALWWGSRHERHDCYRRKRRWKRLATLKKARRSLTCLLSAWQRKWPSLTNSHSSPVSTPSATETREHGAVTPATRPSLLYQERWSRCGEFLHILTSSALIDGPKSKNS